MASGTSPAAVSAPISSCARRCDGFHADADIAEALSTARRSDITVPTSPDGNDADALAALRSTAAGYPEEVMATAGYGHERLDQLVTELLLGVR